MERGCGGLQDFPGQRSSPDWGEMAKHSPVGFAAAEHLSLSGGELINGSKAAGTPEDADRKTG